MIFCSCDETCSSQPCEYRLISHSERPKIPSDFYEQDWRKKADLQDRLYGLRGAAACSSSSALGATHGKLKHLIAGISKIQGVPVLRLTNTGATPSELRLREMIRFPQGCQSATLGWNLPTPSA
jgi:hypothetical protein